MSPANPEELAEYQCHERSEVGQEIGVVQRAPAEPDAQKATNKKGIARLCALRKLIIVVAVLVLLKNTAQRL